jgi:hypothetical protein
MEVLSHDPNVDHISWLERADQVGQVDGSSPFGPTIPNRCPIFYL